MTVRRSIFVVALVMSLAACVSLPTENRPVDIYRLAPARLPAGGMAARTPMPTSLTIEKPEVPVGFDSDRIALIIGRQRLDYYAGARWPGALPAVIQEDVVASLQNRYRFTELGDRAAEGRAAYRLEIAVSDFEPVYTRGMDADPTLNVGVVLTLISRADGRVVSTFAKSKTRPLTANTLTAVTAGLGDMLQELILTGFDQLSRNLVH